MTSSADTRCTRTRCLDQAQTLKNMRECLGPALPPGGDPVEALTQVVGKATELLRQRNACAGALRRIHKLWSEARINAGIVLADDLAAAMYIREDETP